jgi:hypothetical protein
MRLFSLLYTKNEDDDLVSKTCRLDEDTRYLYLSKLDVDHVYR